MNNFIKKLFLLTLFFFSLTYGFANEGDKKNFLVVFSFHPVGPWSKQLISGFESLSKKYNIEYHIEYVDKLRTDNTLGTEGWINYLNEKYKLIKFDAILLDGEFASTLFKKIKNRFSDGIPMVFITGAERNLKENIHILSKNRSEYLHLNTVDMMLRHNPKLEIIYLIEEQLFEFSLSEKVLLKKLENSNIKVKLLKNYTFDELYSKVSTLPKNSAIFYNVIFRDKNNKRLSPYLNLEHITKNANVPVYSSLGTLINRGIVGGNVINGKQSMQSLVEAAMDYIENKEFKKEYKYNESIVDWNVIKKFNIDESLIDKNTKIINKPKSILDTHLYEITIIFFIILILLLLLTITVFFNYRLKKLYTRLRVETRKRLKNEQILSQRSRMAAMGEMLGNIAHQWRQPLSRINSNVSVISINLEKNQELVDDKLNDIEVQTKYMSTTIEDFLNFYNPKKSKKKFFVKKTIDTSLSLISSRLSDIKIVFFRNNDFKIHGYEGEFSQVVLTIINNAIDNFQRRNIKNPKIAIKVKDNTDSVQIKIIDNGGGIDEAIIEKIFDPYFSTRKEVNTGLGLYISKMIVENSMKGKLSVNVEDNCSEFTISINK